MHVEVNIMTDEQFKQPTETHTGTTQEELTASTPVEEPGTGSEQSSGDQQAAGGAQAEEQARYGGPDDFRDSLTNLSAALDRFGKAAEARVRLELEQGRPEINRTVDEIKRGLDGLIRKSGGLLDTFTRRLNRDDGDSSQTGAESGQSSTTEYRVETEPTTDAASQTAGQGEATPHRVETEPTTASAASDLPGHGDVSGNQHSSPVDFPPPAAGESPATSASGATSVEPDVAPAPPKDADSRP
jgi:hypothetical protein